MTAQRIAVALAFAGAAAIAVGIGMVSLPAGVIAAGVQAVGAAYLIAYLGAGRKK